MKRTMKAKRSMRYGTRRLEAGDIFECSVPHSKVLVAAKYAEYSDADRPKTEVPPIPARLRDRIIPRVSAVPDPQPDELTELRSEYETKIGRRPYWGWNAEMLREKIAEAESVS